MRILEEHEARHTALQVAITAGLASGVVENFSMAVIQKELDNE